MIDTKVIPLALNAWGFDASQVNIYPISTGLINLTYRVETASGERYALQQLAPIFGREVHQDIAAVTEHLVHKHLKTPTLVRTNTGDLDVELEDNMGLWRLMTWVDGECRTLVSEPTSAYEAGVALGRFHSALADFNTPFIHTRLGVHDTPRHLNGLRSALTQYAHHPDFSEIQPIAHSILTYAESLESWDSIQERVVHGDPKITNLIFSQEGKGLAWVDLDTVSRMALPLELGDAFRSWCNPLGENAEATKFNLDLFEAAVHGYATGARDTIQPWEQELIVPGCRQIILELAARFCRDALEEQYFGWDKERYSSRSKHNQVRAKSQLALFIDLEQQLTNAEYIAKHAFSQYSAPYPKS